VESSSTASLAPLVSAAWLAAHLSAPDLVVLDCSWYLPSSGRDADAEYRARHIPGALRLDLDAISDSTSDLPHMLPAAPDFAAVMERMGVRPSDRVICYDGSGVNLSAARAWWTFRIFGHRDSAVLDGGFPAWAAATRPVQRGVITRPPTGYRVPELDRAMVRDRRAVEVIAEAYGPTQIVDCRPALRFEGKADEPRAGVRRGNIPGSINLPFTELTDEATGVMRSPAALRKLFEAHQIDASRPIVALCGSGTSAAGLALAVEVLRTSNDGPVGPPVAIYDGSWTEWGKV
jgi:thiosulfate/3-mercaptopyruvate sulfurtransferase